MQNSKFPKPASTCLPAHPPCRQGCVSTWNEAMQEGRGQARDDSRHSHTYPSHCPFSLDSPFLPLAVSKTQLTQPLRSLPVTPDFSAPLHPRRAQVPSSSCWGQELPGQGSVPETCPPSTHASGKTMCKVQARVSNLGSPLVYPHPGSTLTGLPAHMEM